MANEIDQLMEEDPLELAKDEAKIAKVVAYHRNLRALREKGIKPAKADGPKVAFTLDQIGLGTPKPDVKRRV